jgi:hypothetical protein
MDLMQICAICYSTPHNLDVAVAVVGTRSGLNAVSDHSKG